MSFVCRRNLRSSTPSTICSCRRAFEMLPSLSMEAALSVILRLSTITDLQNKVESSDEAPPRDVNGMADLCRLFLMWNRRAQVCDQGRRRTERGVATVTS